MAQQNTQPVVTVQGGPAAPATSTTLLGQGPIRIPVGGRIRAGIKVLTKKAAEQPKAQALYDQGVAAGRSFDQIERAIAEALPQLKAPLVPRNVAWFTVRGQDFPNPEIAQQILDAHGEDRGEGHRLYRFPVVFPSDHWQTVMPHELAAWGAQEKRYWSQYSVDGRLRHCMCHALCLWTPPGAGRSASSAGARPCRERRTAACASRNPAASTSCASAT